jgi:hypothetical protein
MSTLAEIEAATETLPQEQKVELLCFIAASLRSTQLPQRNARMVRQGNDTLLEAPSGAPPMTPENVRRMLEDWP